VELNPRAQAIKKARRDLMQALALFYPVVQPDFTMLLSALPESDADMLRRDLAYLTDKGYVRQVHSRPNQPWSARQYELTAKGKEIVDDIVDDPALEP